MGINGQERMDPKDACPSEASYAQGSGYWSKQLKVQRACGRSMLGLFDDQQGSQCGLSGVNAGESEGRQERGARSGSPGGSQQAVGGDSVRSDLHY